MKSLILLISILVSINSLASDEVKEMNCISIDNQVALIDKSLSRKYILTDSALTKNNCPAEILYSIGNAVFDDLNGWKIVHGKKENIGKIESLAIKNREIFLKKMNYSSNASDAKWKMAAFQVGVYNFSGITQEICKFRLGSEKDILGVSISFHTSDQIAADEFCFSVPTILAVNGLEIYDNRGVFMVKRSAP